MKRLCWGLLLILLSPPVVAGQVLSRFEFSQRHMGVPARLVLYAPEEPSAVRAATAAFQEIARLDSLMSDYRADSEVARLAAAAGGPPVPVSVELFDVLSRAQALARLSGGAFDVTAGPLVQLWRAVRRSGALPAEPERQAALARTGWRNLRLDPVARTARLTVPGMRLDLGGIAKGYAADAAIATLARHGIERALVEMGGDIVVGAPPPGRRGWRIRVPHAPPDQEWRLLAHAAVSTSGDTEQFVEIGGTRFSHVVDPATGLGLTTRVAATVVAPDGVTADALSTLLSVTGVELGPALVREHFPGVYASVRGAGGAEISGSR